MITTKSSISDVAAVLDPSQLIQEQIGKKIVYKFCTYLLFSIYQSGNVIWSEEQIF